MGRGLCFSPQEPGIRLDRAELPGGRGSRLIPGPETCWGPSRFFQQRCGLRPTPCPGPLCAFLRVSQRPLGQRSGERAPMQAEQGTRDKRALTPPRSLSCFNELEAKLIFAIWSAKHWGQRNTLSSGRAFTKVVKHLKKCFLTERKSASGGGGWREKEGACQPDPH